MPDVNVFQQDIHAYKCMQPKNLGIVFCLLQQRAISWFELKMSFLLRSHGVEPYVCLRQLRCFIHCLIASIAFCERSVQSYRVCVYYSNWLLLLLLLIYRNPNIHSTGFICYAFIPITIIQLFVFAFWFYLYSLALSLFPPSAHTYRIRIRFYLIAFVMLIC